MVFYEETKGGQCGSGHRYSCKWLDCSLILCGCYERSLAPGFPQPPVQDFFFFQFILYWFQVYNLVVRQSYTLRSVPLNISSTPNGTIHSYCNITGYILYAFLMSP